MSSGSSLALASSTPTANSTLQAQIQTLMSQLIELQGRLLDLLQAQKRITPPVTGVVYSPSIIIDINALDGDTHKVEMYEDVTVRIMPSKGYVSTCQVVATYENGVENITVPFNQSVDPMSTDFSKEVILSPINQKGILKNVLVTCNNGTVSDSSEIVIAASGKTATLQYLLNGKDMGQAGGVVAEPEALSYCFGSAVNVLKVKSDKFNCVWGGKTIKTITLANL